MTDRKEKLRADIKTKFETVTYFCKLAGYDHRNFYTFLNSSKDNEEMYQEALNKCNTIKVKHIEGNIRKEDRESIRICIAKYYKYKTGALTSFAKDNTDFDTNYLSNIITGRLKYETRKYNLLLELLKKDYNLKLKPHDKAKQPTRD
jgi:hypothetical protein